jgi:hypothetical protein
MGVSVDGGDMVTLIQISCGVCATELKKCALSSKIDRDAISFILMSYFQAESGDF